MAELTWDEAAAVMAAGFYASPPTEEQMKVGIKTANEVLAKIRGDATPNLGLATTEQLLGELTARIDMDYSQGGGGLQYTTVYGRP